MRLSYPLDAAGAGAVPLFEPATNTIAGVDALIDALLNNGEYVYGKKFNAFSANEFADSTSDGRWESTFMFIGNPEGNDAVPNIPANCHRASLGATPFSLPSGYRKKFLTAFQVLASGSGVTQSPNGMTALLVDRLFQMGDFDGSVLTAETVSPAGHALSRYADGEGNRIYIEVRKDFSSTAATIFVTYTNQDGTGSRVTELRDFGINPYYKYIAGSVLEMPLQDGDSGVRSIQSVDVESSFGATARFNVLIGHPIAASENVGKIGVAADKALGMSIEEVDPDACLFFMSWDTQTDPMSWTYSIQFVEA